MSIHKELFQRISDSMAASHEKRRHQTRRIYELKIDDSSMTDEIKDIIEQLYKEAKWVYNYLVRLIKVDGASSNAVCNRSSMAKVNRIPVYNKFTGTIETKKLKRLRSSQRVEIQQFVYTNVSRLRRKGLKISEALKFKSQITNIPLRQYRITHRIISHNKLKIQGITNKSNSSYLRVRGLDKIYNNPNIDIASAALVKRPSGYYVKLVTYSPKEPEKELINDSIAAYFGDNDIITLSDGRVFDYSCSFIKKRIRKLNAKLSRQQKGSSNYKKTLAAIELAYEKLNNKRNDHANKFMSIIKKYNRIVILDDNTLGEKKKAIFGFSAIDKIRARIEPMKNDKVVVLDKMIPITQWCHKCGAKINTAIGDEFHCTRCGLIEANNIHTAKNMKFILDNFIPVGRREFNYVEFGNYLRSRASNWEA